MKDVSDEDLARLEAAWCRGYAPCDCPAGNCKLPPASGRRDWIALAAGLNTTVPGLVALASKNAVVVPSALTDGMARVISLRDPTAVHTVEFRQPGWEAALAQSPYKGGAHDHD